MMVGTISSTASTVKPKTSSQQVESTLNPTRSPLLPSERDNGVVGPRRPKWREITSRYLSPSTSTSTSTTSSSSSRRCPTPLVSRPTSSTSANTPLPATVHSMIKRSQSVERRRPATARPTTRLPESRMGNATEVSVASKILFTSTRSLSVSFQGESFSLPISKTKAVPSPNLTNARKGTPERRKTATPLRSKVDGGRGGDQTENSKPVDQQRWPARTRQVDPLTRSMDCTAEKKKLIGSGAVGRALQKSMIEEGRRASFDGRLHQGSGNMDLVKSVQRALDADYSNGFAVPADLTASDTESVSSGSTSSVQECSGVSRGRSGARGLSVPARFWQETSSRLRRLQDPGSPLSSSTGSRTAAAATHKLISSKKSLTESPISSPRTVSTGSGRALSSPIRGSSRPASPSKFMTSSTSSPSRGMPSPSRTRNAVAAASSLSNSGNMPSILSFAADVRRGKLGENRIVDAHLLRLLYNRHLQWRFVNARADASLLLQRLTAEKNLYNAWVTTSELRDSVTVKKIKLQLLRQNLKLTSILKGQMTYLEEWALLDRDHSSSLSGAIEALKASTLRLPVVCGAKADIQNVKDAVGSAVDVMQAMASSICSLLSKVEEVNSLAAELANVTAQEQALLDQCRDLLSTLAALQVKDCSLRTHILQLKRVPSNLTTQV
ncbi:QWRF motif-containing protein 2-like [Telopea speciosissima]|uniref:QWRF motif-containing protein 2-like n=1 Tax=Telopea speciosissima TaxID=54955 RepID=UPI001CC6AB1B|nr:QWRF motif-containing protein 2-like [Telopea speciosissima]